MVCKVAAGRCSCHCSYLTLPDLYLYGFLGVMDIGMSVEIIFCGEGDLEPMAKFSGSLHEHWSIEPACFACRHCIYILHSESVWGEGACE